MSEIGDRHQMVWPWLTGSILSITKMEMVQLRKAASPFYELLSVGKTTCPYASPHRAPWARWGAVHGGKKTKFSRIGEKKLLWCLGFLFLSLPFYLSPLLNSSFLPNVLACLLGVETAFLSQEIKSVGHLCPETLARNQSWRNNVCSLICIFCLHWILDSFCFFLI